MAHARVATTHSAATAGKPQSHLQPGVSVHDAVYATKAAAATRPKVPPVPLGTEQASASAAVNASGSTKNMRVIMWSPNCGIAFGKGVIAMA